MSDLVASLRDMMDGFLEGIDTLDDCDIKIVREAADDIERLRAENERLRAALRTFTDFASRLHSMSDEELEAWRKAAQDVIDRALQEGDKP